MNERHPGFSCNSIAVPLRFRIAVACKDYFRIESAHGFHLDLRSRVRHHDQRANPKPFRGQRDALRMISRTRRDYAAPSFFLRKPDDPVVGPTNLEAEHRLLVFSLQEHGIPEPLRKARRRIERGLSRNFVNAAG